MAQSVSRPAWKDSYARGNRPPDESASVRFRRSIGKPCQHGFNAGMVATVKRWGGLAATLAKVLASPPVDDSTFDARMDACGRCEHLTSIEPADGPDRLYCGCCTCPNWSQAELHVKNRYSGHACPADPPLFDSI